MAAWRKRDGILCGIAAVGVALLIISMAMALGQLSDRRRELATACEALHGSAVLHRRANGGRGEADIAAMEDYVRACRQRFDEAVGPRQREELHGPAPRVPTKAEFYFDLQEESHRLDALAEANGIILLEGRHFGFVDTVREGKMDSIAIERWRREIGEIHMILEALFTAGKGDLRFQTIGRESISPQELAKFPNDLFDARRVRSLRPFLGSETNMYRLQFQCGTGSFRNFLNALEDQHLPVVPREIHAETPIPRQRADADNRWLVVNPQPTHFTVLLEWVRLSPISSGGAEPPAGGGGIP
jgi:hypothetical protein